MILLVWQKVINFFYANDPGHFRKYIIFLNLLLENNLKKYNHGTK